MDVTAVLLRAAAVRPRALLATMPGGSRVRVTVEQELRRRDLPDALTPAQADLLLVAGPNSPSLRPAVERLWQDMSGPRSRAHVRRPEEAAEAIETCRARLADPVAQQGYLQQTGTRHGRQSSDGNTHSAHDGHSGHEEHGRHARGSSAQQSHGEHGGHGDGAMGMPGGLPMAEQGADRDGLTLDRLHVPLGPLLAHWPAGLTARLTLQGDVIQDVAISTASADGTCGIPFWSEPWLLALAGEEIRAGEAARRRAAAHLDSLSRLLAVAGWPAAATIARRLRDDLLAGAAGAQIRPLARRFAKRVSRSRTLHALTRGMGELSAAQAHSQGVDGPAARADGDVPARYRQWLGDVLEALDRLEDPRPLEPTRDEGPRGLLDAERWPSGALVDLLPRMLPGAELAAARLIVASLDPDPDELAGRQGVVARG
jgi:hypothetical protein